jgi:hypothetical protein
MLAMFLPLNFDVALAGFAFAEPRLPFRSPPRPLPPRPRPPPPRQGDGLCPPVPVSSPGMLFGVDGVDMLLRDPIKLARCPPGMDSVVCGNVQLSLRYPCHCPDLIQLWVTPLSPSLGSAHSVSDAPWLPMLKIGTTLGSYTLLRAATLVEIS